MARHLTTLKSSITELIFLKQAHLLVLGVTNFLYKGSELRFVKISIRRSEWFIIILWQYSLRRPRRRGFNETNFEIYKIGDASVISCMIAAQIYFMYIYIYTYICATHKHETTSTEFVILTKMSCTQMPWWYIGKALFKNWCICSVLAKTKKKCFSHNF